jgi:hypothetical protein
LPFSGLRDDDAKDSCNRTLNYGTGNRALSDREQFLDMELQRS